jgi:homeobox protein cut-like
LLSEAPDPYPLLEASVDSLLLSEDTLPKVTQENEHLQQTVSKLTTQLEETESRLAFERAARKSLEEGLETKIKDVESSWAAVLEEKNDNWEAKEKLLEEKIEKQDRLLNEIKASYEVTQRLGQQNEDSGRGYVTSAELEMVNSDLERTSVRLAEVEARNEQLRIELAQSASQVPSQPALVLEDDPGYMRMRSENSSLLRKLDAARVERDARQRELDGKLRSLEREIGMLNEERDALKSKVQKWSDYEDVKQELEVLKSIEFSTGDDDDVQDLGDSTPAPGNSETGSSAKGKGDTLEQLLLARNKKLSEELTILRVSHQDLQSRLQSMQEDLSKTNADLERAQHLNETLENDLANMQHETATAYPSGASVAGTHASRYPQSSANFAAGSFAGRKGRVSPTSSVISGFDPRSSSLRTTSLEALRSGEPVGGGSGILPMITAQRDRFKKRNTQLENELSECHHTVSSLRQEIASLQKDNLNLYEKTRYVSTYSRAGPTSSSASAYATNPNPSTIQMSSSTSSGLALDRYRSAYESNISPFAAFRGRESARAYKRMSLPERIVFSITRMVLATRTSRNLFAGYCVALHVLVFFALYWLGTVDSEKHASNLGQTVVAAAAGPFANAGAGSQHGDWHQEGFSEKGSLGN